MTKVAKRIMIDIASLSFMAHLLSKGTMPTQVFNCTFILTLNSNAYKSSSYYFNFSGVSDNGWCS